MTVSTSRFTVTSAAYVAVAANVSHAHVHALTTGGLRLIGATALPASDAAAFLPVHDHKIFDGLDPATDVIYVRAVGDDVEVVVFAY